MAEVTVHIGQPKLLSEMTEQEVIDELVEAQRTIIVAMDPHERLHQIIRVRTGVYMKDLMDQAECGTDPIAGHGTGEPLGFLNNSATEASPYL